jgi:uncharacterized OsmC-like protein
MKQQTATIEKPAQMVNGIDMEVLGETIRAVADAPELGKSRFRARNTWQGGSRNCTTVSSFYAGGQENVHEQTFVLHSDEPTILAGSDEDPNPVEHLLNALAGCVTTTIVAHAAVRGIHIDAVESELEGDIDINGFFGLNPETPRGYSDIRVKFRIESDADVEVLKELATYSPVFNTITRGANVDIQVEKKQA